MPTSRNALVIVAAIVLAGAPVAAAPNLNIIFHANLDQHPGYANIWGYTAPNGAEYALVGGTDGLFVVNVSNPAAPYETGFIPGPLSTWREMKSYGHYCYVGSEGGAGIQIVDLVDPENPVQVGAYTAGGLLQSHSVHIDEGAGLLYVNGSQSVGVGGMRILSLANPIAPVEVGSWEVDYVHDCMARNGRCYAAAIFSRILYVLNVTNPAIIPAPLGTAQGYPHAFPHNAWLTEDNQYVLSTDEESGAACRMWDVSTVPVLQQTDAYLANGVSIPHNAHIEGNLAFVSHYTLGIKVLDVSDPSNMVELAAYDTWPSDDGGTFNGCWGVFPYFQTNTNLIVASDMTTGLWVLEYRGPLGTLAGEVTRAGNPSVKISGATIEILQSGTTAQTNAVGQYTIQDVAGSVDVQVSAFGYQTATVPATIVTGVTTTLNVALNLLPSGALAGDVTDAATTSPIAGAQVAILTTPLVDLTDATGAYLHDPVPAGSYTARATAFGYNPMQAAFTITQGNTHTVDFPLNVAPVATTFETADAGWAVSGGATSGAWERADPQPTFDGATPMQSGDDHTPAPGTRCWVTGPLAGTVVGSFDVDGGETILTSPSFALAGSDDPHVAYWRWYAVGVVGNASRDFWTVRVSTNGGGSWVNIENTDQSSNAWVLIDVPLRSLIVPTNLTRFQFTARDTGAGSVVEAALDDFMIYDGPDVLPTGAPLSSPGSHALQLGQGFPNPFRNGQVVAASFQVPKTGRVVADVHDVMGRRVAVLVDERMDAGAHRLEWDGRSRDGRECAAGIYFLRLRAGAEELSRKILRLR